MTNEELQAHIAALNKAAAEGLLQGRSHGMSGEWFAVDSPVLAPAGYRIKPQPREWYLSSSDIDMKKDRLDEGAPIDVYTRHHDGPHDGSRLFIHVREVLE